MSQHSGQAMTPGSLLRDRCAVGLRKQLGEVPVRTGEHPAPRKKFERTVLQGIVESADGSPEVTTIPAS
jgi:hypothetical protein